MFPPLMGGCSEGLDAFREHQIKELQVCKSSVCMVTHIPRVWINRVRLQILLVVSWRGKILFSPSAFVPDNSVSRDGFGSPVPCQPAHSYTQAEPGAYMGDSSRVRRRRPFLYLKPPDDIRPLPSLSGHAACVPMAFTAESPPTEGQ